MTSSHEPLEKKLKESARKAARVIILCTFLLIAIGWVMLLDTGLVFEGQANPEHFHNLIFKRLICTGAGIFILGIIWILPARWIRYLSLPAVIAGLVLLGFVLSPYGVEERGSQRWLEIAGFRFQPLELVKLTIVWFLADQLARTGSLSRIKFGRLAFPGLVIALTVTLIALQPNLSGAIFIILLTFAMAWLGGINGRLTLSLAGVAVAACAAMLAFNPDRLARFLPVFRPLSELDGAGYQVGLSIWAITSGGLLGLGPGSSVAMYSLPDHTTDFIFSIICEEWGLVGGVTVILIIGILVYHGFRLSLSQEDPFRMLFGCGVSAIIGLQAAINIGVTLGILPTTGMPLPFLSSGGSNLVLSLTEIGLLLNLSQTAGMQMEELRTNPARSGNKANGQRSSRSRQSVIERNYRPADYKLSERKRRVASQ